LAVFQESARPSVKEVQDASTSSTAKAVWFSGGESARGRWICFVDENLRLTGHEDRRFPRGGKRFNAEQGAIEIPISFTVSVK
jgi:hypothetical protein